MSLSWCQKVSPTQGGDKERRESVCSTVDRGKERIDERNLVSKTHGHNKKLLDLQMSGNGINTYNTRFNHLLARSAWPHGDKGTMERYRRGLQQGITLKIYDKTPMPQTLDEWQEAAQTEVLRQAQINADLGPNPFPRREGPQNPQRPQGGGYRPRDPSLATIPMDLSMGRLGGNLSDADKKKLMDEGRCFYCKEKGHCANRCPKKPQQRPPTTQTTFPSHARVTEATNSEGTKEEVWDLRMQLQAMTTEDRGELLDSLMRDDLDF